MIETLSSEKTNRHDERHEECHGGSILRVGAGGGPTCHFAVKSIMNGEVVRERGEEREPVCLVFVGSLPTSGLCRGSTGPSRLRRIYADVGSAAARP
jgi:hypothetical protein